MTENEILASAVKTLEPQEMMEVFNAYHSILTCLHGLPIGLQALALGLAGKSVQSCAINCKTPCDTSTS